ncbi:MAG: hypothetical protein MUC48_01010 [Leptolyngbya sp. Prado105]|nr:hypothetical protein [Leptolyngbya sp. Prado105]
MRSIVAIILSVFIWLSGTMNAWALVQIKLSDVSYRECPEDLALGAVTAGGVPQSARCFIVFGKATNPTNKQIVNADIFGRIYDANDDPIIENRNRLGSIAEVPPGVSEFEFQINVPESQPLPLQLLQFKAAGFTGTVRR